MAEHAPRIGIVGAGIAGLACGRLLRAAGLPVTLFERDAASGGRVATRRNPWGEFDHGAQYFTAHTPAFKALLKLVLDAGAVTRWPVGFRRMNPLGLAFLPEEERWVGRPGMSALPTWMASGLAVQHGADIIRIARRPGGWMLQDRSGREWPDFDWLVLSAPAPDTRILLDIAGSPLAEAAGQAVMAACWALMASPDVEEELPFAAAAVDDEAVSWIAANHTKPGRPAGPTWVVHAASRWSEVHRHLTEQEVAGRMVDALVPILGRRPVLQHAEAHLWPWAEVLHPLGEPYLLDADARIAACGDWCLGARLENAFTSGVSLGRALRSVIGAEGK